MQTVTCLDLVWMGALGPVGRAWNNPLLIKLESEDSKPLKVPKATIFLAR